MPLNTTLPKLEDSIVVLMNHQPFNDVNPALVGEKPLDDLVAYCLDLPGNGLRFRPWSLPFDWQTPAVRLPQPMTGIGGFRV